MTLRHLFAPTSVAVVGASATAGKAGYALMRSLETMPGTVHPVNPAGGRIAGRTAYPRVTAIPEPVDLAVLAVPPAAVPEALDDCGRAGVRAAVICAGGAPGTVAFHDAADEFSAKRLLAAAGMPVPPGRVCQDRAAAAGALAELGAPVVVKLLNPELPHKSEHGGVHLDVRTDADLDRALDALDTLAARLPFPSRYLVERQAPAGTDLIIGATRDPSFGPTVLLARGGVDVEIAADPVLRMVPITREDAREMVESLPTALLRGYRGAPPLDVEALIASLLTVASIIQSNPGITELDVNPLRLTPDGPLALDALVVEAPAVRPVPARRHTTTGGLR